jgi:hypothetical protein
MSAICGCHIPNKPTCATTWVVLCAPQYLVVGSVLLDLATNYKVGYSEHSKRTNLAEIVQSRQIPQAP